MPRPPTRPERRSPADWKRTLPLRAPEEVADTFRLLRLYDPAAGLEALLARIDMSGSTLASLRHSVFGHEPCVDTSEQGASAFDPRACLLELLTSGEFQSEVIRLFLQAFPQKRRIVFVHVPKCAGSDLIAHLTPLHLSIPYTLTIPRWAPQERFLSMLADLGGLVDLVSSVFVHGHLPFHALAPHIGFRPADRVFTVLRDPVDVMVSDANFKAGLLARDPQLQRPDTRNVARFLGVDRMPVQVSDGFLSEMALRLLLEADEAGANRATSLFGGGKLDLALQNIATYDVEITTVTHYQAWLRERWQITERTRRNRSPPLLTDQVLRPHLDELRARAERDRQIYARVTRALQQSGRSWVGGGALV